MRSRVAVAVAIAEGRSIVQLRPLVFRSPAYRPRKQNDIVRPVLRLDGAGEGEDHDDRRCQQSNQLQLRPLFSDPFFS